MVSSYADALPAKSPSNEGSSGSACRCMLDRSTFLPPLPPCPPLQGLCPVELGPGPDCLCTTALIKPPLDKYERSATIQGGFQARFLQSKVQLWSSLVTSPCCCWSYIGTGGIDELLSCAKRFGSLMSIFSFFDGYKR